MGSDDPRQVNVEEHGMAENNYAALMDPASERAKRGGFFFILLFAGIIFAAWFLARFLWGGTGTPPTLDFGLGVVLTVLMLASLAPMIAGRRRLDQGDDAGALGNVGVLLIVPLLMIVGIIYSWGAVTIGSGYGGIYIITGGWFVLHFLGGFLALLASYMKGKRAPERAKREHWVTYNVLSYWGALVALWSVFFVVFYVA
ncbi:MAG: cytochrome C oxidase subunit III [Acidiferrobacter sp.]